MRLSRFITVHMDDILGEWEAFAATLAPMAHANKVELRDHASQVLRVIAADLDTPQGERQSIAKSQGLAPVGVIDTPAETHAATRMSSGLDSDQLMAEFRALRSSVLRLWTRDLEITTPEEIQDMVRFNEAIDQAQSESMARYSKLMRDAQNLFLAILGHDVRSPLGAVSMGAQALLHDPSLPAKVAEVGMRIFKSSKRVDEIVRDLLDFSTSHLSDGIPVEPHPLDLGALCLNVVEEARTFHPERAIELSSTGELNGNWDGSRLAQAFANLISNAIQHGAPGTAILTRIEGKPDSIEFEVSNQGERIAPEKLRMLFDPVKTFAIRPPSERTLSRAQNLGLGLYVVKEIVKAHGGQITASSTEAEGVKFCVSLPRQVAAHRHSLVSRSAPSD
jgi:signal transduction histidine kinase